jgi:cytochrome c biogenesis protein CcdA/thiol-disulfide isomerase/thioredoxin
MTPELIVFVFLAGVATVLSPCVLPVLPLVLSTTAGAGRLRPLGVVLGLAVSFTLATLVFGAAVQALALPAAWLRMLAIVALGIFGLAMLVPAWGRAMERLLTPLSRLANRGPGNTGNTGSTGFGGGLLMGAGLGLLWTPCVGPIMGTVIFLAVTNGLSNATLGITLAYALGAGVPMLVIAYGARGLLSRTRGLRPHAETIRRVFGGLTVLACLALLFGLETRVQTVLPAQFANALTSFERQESIQKELKNLETTERGDTSLPPSVAALQPADVQPTHTPVPPTSVPTTAAENPKSAGVAPPPPPQNPGGPGPRPELTGLTEWINSKPLTLQALRGKVVIIDFWTFDCYNCQNTRPYVRALYDKYKDKGLEILGIHAPEFAFERVPDNVRKAAKEQGVTWPIALDPDFKTWSAYNNRYWPAFYFIDARGHIRYTHFGEGNYEYHDKVVQQLLSEL